MTAAALAFSSSELEPRTIPTRGCGIPTPRAVHGAWRPYRPGHPPRVRPPWPTGAFYAGPARTWRLAIHRRVRRIPFALLDRFDHVVWSEGGGMHRRELGIGAAVVVAAVLMVTAGFEIGARARARQSAAVPGAPSAAPDSTVTDSGPAATAGPGAGPGAPVPEPGSTGAGGSGPAGPGVGASVPATGRLLAAPSAPARIAAGIRGGLTCARLGVGVTGLVPAACGGASLAPSGRPVVWVSGRVPGSRALALQVWSPAGDGTWQRSLVASEPRPARTWTAIRVATPALSAGGRTRLAPLSWTTTRPGARQAPGPAAPSRVASTMRGSAWWPAPSGTWRATRCQRPASSRNRRGDADAARAGPGAASSPGSRASPPRDRPPSCRRRPR